MPSKFQGHKPNNYKLKGFLSQGSGGAIAIRNIYLNLVHSFQKSRYTQYIVTILNY